MAGRFARHGRSAAAVAVGLAGCALQLGCATAAADDGAPRPAGAESSTSSPARAGQGQPARAVSAGRAHGRGSSAAAAAVRSAAAQNVRVRTPALAPTALPPVVNAARPTPVEPNPVPARPVAAAAAARTTPVAAAARTAPAEAAVPPSVRPQAPAAASAPGLQQIGPAVTQALDVAAARLDGLPANAVNDVLQGALQLARSAWTEASSRRSPRPTLGWVPRYDHIVVVVLENHSLDEILGKAATEQPPVPYINDVLVPGGALMTASYGLQHPSQPNYYWLFSGSSQGVTSDQPPIRDGVNLVHSTAPNLYTELQGLCRPKTFTGYVEGYTGEADFNSPGGIFRFQGTIASEPGKGELTNVVRHMPWAGFLNVPQSVTTGVDSFGPDYSALPDVSFIIPALQHDMHNYGFGALAENSDVATSDTSMANADAWLAEHIDDYAQWARTHNSLLIVTTDEDSSADWVTPPLTAENYAGPSGPGPLAPGAPGYTSAAQGPSATAGNPDGSAQSGSNQMFTLFYGAHVVPGTYANPVTHVNVLRTIEASMGVHTKAGAQPSFVNTDSNGRPDRSLRFTNRAVSNIFSVCIR